MQRRAKITSKGQVTLPLDIRRLLGVRAGDKVLFESGRSGVRVRSVRTVSPFENYRGIGNPGIGAGREAVVRWVRNLRDE